MIGPGQFCEVRYEELVADPIEQMRRVYEELELGRFRGRAAGDRQYFAKQKDYKTNRYEMTPELRAEITRRWATFIQQYGYAEEEVAVGSRRWAVERRAVGS